MEVDILVLRRRDGMLGRIRGDGALVTLDIEDDEGLRALRGRFILVSSVGMLLPLLSASSDGEELPSKNETGMENSDAGRILGLIVSKRVVVVGDRSGVKSSVVELPPIVSGVSALLDLVRLLVFM